ncbi:MAG TPA: VTT domain-containing protein, partial [Bryobacteraceae bacterium]
AGAGDLDIVTICALLIVASILGDQCGYFLGNRAGVTIFDRPDSRFFKRQFITDTEAFYRKHGGKTLIYAKFVPIIRTFAPFMAGVGKMPYLRFLRFNVVGGLLWVIAVVIAGFYLGQFALVRRHFEKVVLLVVLISVLPIIMQLLKSRMAAPTPAE